jgi:hypothetical protein
VGILFIIAAILYTIINIGVFTTTDIVYITIADIIVFTSVAYIAAIIGIKV